MVGEWKEGGRWRVARRKKQYLSMFGTGTDLPEVFAEQEGGI